MEDLAVFLIIESLRSENHFLSTIVPNVVKSATFQAKIYTNGKKQTRIKSYTTNFHIFVCNGGHDVSSKEFEAERQFKFSKFKIRIKNKKPVLIFGDTVIYDFLNIPIQPNVIYWVSWKTKSHSTLRNRSDVFCLIDGELTNKIVSPKNKTNKKYQTLSGYLYKWLLEFTSNGNDMASGGWVRVMAVEILRNFDSKYDCPNPIHRLRYIYGCGALKRHHNHFFILKV